MLRMGRKGKVVTTLRRDSESANVTKGCNVSFLPGHEQLSCSTREKRIENTDLGPEAKERNSVQVTEISTEDKDRSVHLTSSATRTEEEMCHSTSSSGSHPIRPLHFPNQHNHKLLLFPDLHKSHTCKQSLQSLRKGLFSPEAIAERLCVSFLLSGYTLPS